ncbi:hydroxymethylbilane synthase [Halobaculum sp. MBLA0143]|uniref:hydroxymethylbilane synthase n=1 Tax=Halobaculum sp. MBLA0143 TaxID=3079933 RepID=UPI003526965C
MSETFTLATRSSDLALRQAERVRSALSTRRLDVELLHVQTQGDQVRDELISELGMTGAFVRAVDERVMDGEADAAVHSMKDMPTEQPPELSVAGVPERAPAGDVLVTPEENGNGLDDLLVGATVGTGSLRRQAQLLATRPDLEVAPLRGNVDTRVQKLLAPTLQAEHERRTEAEDDDSDEEFDRTPDEWFDDLTELERGALERTPDTEYDAIVLAEAGLRRLDLYDHPAVGTQRLPRSEFVPAPGQGALAVTTATPETRETVRSAFDHAPTRVTTTVERTLLAELGGGCVAPIGVHALLQGEHVSVRVRVLSTDGDEEIAESRDLSAERHAEAAREFAADLRERGAAELIAAAREETGGDRP